MSVLDTVDNIVIGGIGESVSIDCFVRAFSINNKNSVDLKVKS